MNKKIHYNQKIVFPQKVRLARLTFCKPTIPTNSCLHCWSHSVWLGTKRLHQVAGGPPKGS